jgi:hypothetical protein
MDKIGPVVIDELHIINDLDARRLEQELHANLSCGGDPIVTQAPSRGNRLDPEKL